MIINYSVPLHGTMSNLLTPKEEQYEFYIGIACLPKPSNTLLIVRITREKPQLAQPKVNHVIE